MVLVKKVEQIITHDAMMHIKEMSTLPVSRALGYGNGMIVKHDRGLDWI